MLLPETPYEHCVYSTSGEGVISREPYVAITTGKTPCYAKHAL